jgi:hypothetical protein
LCLIAVIGAPLEVAAAAQARSWLLEMRKLRKCRPAWRQR